MNTERMALQHAVLGTTFVIDCRGDAGGLDVVWLHGEFGVLDAPPGLERIADHGRVLEVHLPGWGVSEGGDRFDRIEELALATWWAIDRVGVDRPIIAGHGFGGTLAVEMAIQQPLRVAALVLLLVRSACSWPTTQVWTSSQRCSATRCRPSTPTRRSAELSSRATFRRFRMRTSVARGDPAGAGPRRHEPVPVPHTGHKHRGAAVRARASPDDHPVRGCRRSGPGCRVPPVERSVPARLRRGGGRRRPHASVREPSVCRDPGRAGGGAVGCGVMDFAPNEDHELIADAVRKRCADFDELGSGLRVMRTIASRGTSTRPMADGGWVGHRASPRSTAAAAGASPRRRS